MNGVIGSYCARLVSELGIPSESSQNNIPKEDFGGLHPDPNMKKPAEDDVKKVASEKSAKTLLGEFYKDREFLEQIASDETLQSLDMNDQAESVLQIIRLVFLSLFE